MIAAGSREVASTRPSAWWHAAQRQEERIRGHGLECNYGGPMSRQREMTLRATVLGAGRGPLSCPRVRTAALYFGWKEPVAYVRLLLEELGYSSPEAARDVLVRDTRPLACSGLQQVRTTSIFDAAPEAVLEEALVLGLSTRSLFDPARPVIWTHASLTRHLALYDIGGFYA